MSLKSPASAKLKKKKLGKGIFGALGKSSPNTKHVDDDDDADLAAIAAPGIHYTSKDGADNAHDARGRALLRGRSKGDTSRSRSRSSSLFRKLRGKKANKTETEDAPTSTKEKKPKKPTKRSEMTTSRAMPANEKAFHESIDFEQMKKNRRETKKCLTK